MNHKPPVLVRIALSLVHPDRREEIEGDLLELFHDRSSAHGVHRARLLCWRDAFSLLRRPLRSPRHHQLPLTPKDRSMFSMLSMFVRELRYASRNLAKRPGYTLIAALTLALGIGSTVAIFTVLNAIVLRPLRYPAGDRLVEVLHHAPGMSMPVVRSSPGLIARYREHARTLASIAGYNRRQISMQTPDGSERVLAIIATPDLFATLATPASLGRVFSADDAAAGARLVTILTDDFWRQRFAGDPSAIGRTLQLDGQLATIVGVMPRGFAFPDPDTRLFVPMRTDPAIFGALGTTSIARLASGATIESARRELDQLQQRIPEWFPDLTREELSRFHWSVSVEPLRDQVVAGISKALWMLFAIVGFVLVIAAANVANLFLVRAESRQREIAVRSALGAGRGRIAAAFLAEGLVLAAFGALGGVFIASAGTRLLVDYGPARLPRLHEVQLDGTAIAFAALLTVLAAALVALLPVVTFARRSFVVLLRDASRGNTSGAGHRVRRLLIVTQVAIALVLLVGAGLMLRSVVQLSAVDPGFRVKGLITVGMNVSGGVNRTSTIALYNQLVDKMAATPGVRGVAAATSLPLGATGLTGASLAVQSRPELIGRAGPNTMYTGITAEYFRTLGVPVLAGRAPARDDIDQNRSIAWVNNVFARQFLQDHALGERIKFADASWLEVVGVVGDVKTGGLREDTQPMVYLPFTNSVVKPAAMFAVVRTVGDPTSIAGPLRAAVTSVDASVPITLRTMEEIFSGSLAQARFTVVLLSIAAAIGLVLGVVGLYGAVSYTVAQRTAEIGVRVALGAKPAVVCRMVLRQGVSIILVGIAIGLAAAASLARYMSSMLFEVSASDPMTYGAVTLLLLCVGVLATYVPARRAAATNPVDALRVAQ